MAVKKISATLDQELVDDIRRRTDNLSAFLNDAAKQKLYFDRLRELEEELIRKGVPLNKKADEFLRKKIAATRRKYAGKR